MAILGPGMLLVLYSAVDMSTKSTMQLVKMWDGPVIWIIWIVHRTDQAGQAGLGWQRGRARVALECTHALVCAPAQMKPTPMKLISTYVLQVPSHQKTINEMAGPRFGSSCPLGNSADPEWGPQHALSWIPGEAEPRAERCCLEVLARTNFARVVCFASCPSSSSSSLHFLTIAATSRHRLAPRLCYCIVSVLRQSPVQCRAHTLTAAASSTRATRFATVLRRLSSHASSVLGHPALLTVRLLCFICGPLHLVSESCSFALFLSIRSGQSASGLHAWPHSPLQ